MSESLWSTKSRQGHHLHQMCPYQGSFPPQLPAYFLDRLPGKVVLDPFAGRGTVILEAVLRGRTAYGGDISPVARALSQVKLHCAKQADVLEEIRSLDLTGDAPYPPPEIEPFFHPETWTQVYCLKHTEKSPTLTALALGRLHGHSSGFFSGFTFNVISVSGKSLKKAQEKHGTSPEPRDVRILLEKAAMHFIPPGGIQGEGNIYAGDARHIPLPDASVDVVVTSPPFLDVIDYIDVNWLRLWFLGEKDPPATFIRDEGEYKLFLKGCLQELSRVLAPEGTIVFEVGPVKRNTRLDDVVCEAAEGVLRVEDRVTNFFSGEDVPKISRAMTGGEKTTTMENNCVVLKHEGSGRLPEGWADRAEVPPESPSLEDFFG